MAQAISLDDLLSAYREAGFVGDDNDTGATRAELRAAWGCGEKKATQYLNMAMKAGLLRVGWRTVQDIAGRPNRVPVYSFIEKPKARKKVRTT